MKFEEMTLDTEQQVDVKVAIGDVFKGVLHRLGEGNTRPDGVTTTMDRAHPPMQAFGSVA